MSPLIIELILAREAYAKARAAYRERPHSWRSRRELARTFIDYRNAAKAVRETVQ